MTHARLLIAPLALAALLGVRDAGAQVDTTAALRVVPPGPAGPEPRPVTLDESVRLAQRNAPTAIQARGQLRASTAGLRAAKAAYIPNLSVNSSVAQQSPSGERLNPTTGELQSGRWSQTQGFNASVDLFDGFRRLYDIRASRAQIGAAEAIVENEGNVLQLEVRQLFYASIAAREAEDAARSQLTEAETQMRVAVAKARARIATASDSLRASIQVGNAQLALLTARNDRQVADAALGRTIGTPEPVTAAPTDTAGGDIALVVDSLALAQLVGRNPAVEAAQANVAAARANYRAARAPYLPTLSMSYGRNIGGAGADFALYPDDPRYTGSLRFTLSYPIFNQYNREFNVINAAVAEDNAEAQLRDARLAAQQSLVQYLGALRTAQQRVAIQEATVLAAGEDLRVQQTRYQLGASTVLEVVTSQNQLTQARLALIQARLDARVARAQLEALAGRGL